jgi:hypothetical protein
MRGRVQANDRQGHLPPWPSPSALACTYNATVLTENYLSKRRIINIKSKYHEEWRSSSLASASGPQYS